VPEKNDFNLWDKAKQGAGFIWKEHRADQLNQSLNPFYVKPANALREIACTIKPWWDNHFPNTINETPLITNFHFCQTLTKVTDIAPRRKNISYAHQTGKPQLKQQEPHTYPLREVLRQQASPERVQALGCVGMRAS
jgi:hypothetical protein